MEAAGESFPFAVLVAAAVDPEILVASELKVHTERDFCLCHGDHCAYRCCGGHEISRGEACCHVLLCTKHHSYHDDCSDLHSHDHDGNLLRNENRCRQVVSSR